MSDTPDTPGTPTKSMDDIVALCRRRGFIWQSSEIYGGINGFWDYGPLGAALKRNLKNAWWQDIITTPPDGPDGQPLDIVPVDTTIIMHPKVWEASGHVAGFNDPMVDDRATQQRFRADHLIGCFVANPNTSDIAEIRELSDDMQHAIANGQLPTKWQLVATAIGSASEAHLHFISQKRLGRYKVKRGAVNVDPSQVGVTVAELALTLEGPDGRKPLWDIRPIPIKVLATDPASIPSPFTGEPGSLTEPRQFNLMYDVHNGAIRDEANKSYLRPETAQGIFTQFWNVVDTSRVKMPFGIAQQGKAFRNEVTPRNFTFRSREFEQMEIEFFIHPSQANEWYAYWRDSRFAWWKSIGLAGDNLQLREHDKDELAHYAKSGAGTSDIEYRFPFTAPGYGELEGVAHRADFDLKAHANACGKGDKLMYRDPVTNERYFPHVIEPSAGADRGTLAVLCEAYTKDESRASGVYMNFHPRLAPIKAAIFPLVNKDGMPEVADSLYRELRRRWTIETDAKQSIGRRYARMDEAGTPFCFTIDGDTLTNQTVTVRHRDTQQQERIAIANVAAFLEEKIG